MKKYTQSQIAMGFGNISGEMTLFQYFLNGCFWEEHRYPFSYKFQ